MSEETLAYGMDLAEKTLLFAVWSSNASVTVGEINRALRLLYGDIVMDAMDRRLGVAQDAPVKEKAG